MTKASESKVSHGAKELDAEEILDALRTLIDQTAGPVVQECLRSAYCEIAHLSSTEGDFSEEWEAKEDDSRKREVA